MINVNAAKIISLAVGRLIMISNGAVYPEVKLLYNDMIFAVVVIIHKIGEQILINLLIIVLHYLLLYI
jgi:hypothetical protein